VKRRDRVPNDHRGADDRSPFIVTFLRGLSLGALVGAAIAGSALLRRFRDTAPTAPTTGSDPQPR